jgi:hypothetical protein
VVDSDNCRIPPVAGKAAIRCIYICYEKTGTPKTTFTRAF